MSSMYVYVNEYQNRKIDKDFEKSKFRGERQTAEQMEKGEVIWAKPRRKTDETLKLLWPITGCVKYDLPLDRSATSYNILRCTCNGTFLLCFTKEHAHFKT